MGASAALQDRVMAVEPGGEAVARVRVRNTGSVVDHFALQVLGDAAAWASVEPPTLSLFPGAEEVAAIRFRPPRAATVAAGEMPFGIRIVSHEDPQGAVVEEGTLQVGGFRQTSAELVPRNSRGSRSGTHEVAVDNNGNVPVEVFLSGVDPDAALTFGFRPPGLAIGPGRAGFARVRVGARRTFLTGTPKSLPFQIQVASAGEAQITLPGSLVQGPIVSRMVRQVAAGALLAVVAAALLWFLVLKPTITSAAKDAVATAQQSSGGGGTSQQPHPPTPPAGQPSPPAVSQPPPGGGAAGAAFGHRLDQTGAGRTQYRVPAGVTLSITDVVFQNPGGEHGTILLQRDGSTLLVENLDNFRDLDYHFVTPISATANQTMQMTVQCPTGCPSAGIYLNGSEKPS